MTSIGLDVGVVSYNREKQNEYSYACLLERFAISVLRFVLHSGFAFSFPLEFKTSGPSSESSSLLSESSGSAIACVRTC